MMYQPEKIAAACDDREAALARLQDADPFLRARAERHAAVDAEITAIEAGAMDERMRSQVALLRKIRDGLLSEIVGMIEGSRSEGAPRSGQRVSTPNEGLYSIWRPAAATAPTSSKVSLRGSWAWPSHR